MATLGSIYHDFPRLAKQSGFYFQLHKGRVNWTELENLNIDEIIQERNFQLLEHNLINVINCDLEREYDIKILDQNFVKLFKLAQLGLDYLSYCEMYLDRCVVLLQEELTASQQEYECLKQENQRKKEELNRSKRKNKIQSYQCEKCEKVFISDVYLKFHDKRRHSSPNTPQSLDGSQKKSVTDNYQQTENGRTLSTSTQTLYSDEATTGAQENKEAVNIKTQHDIKMEKLEQELQEVKERLKKAETSLREKNETVNSHMQVPGPMNCNPMIMLLPSYLKQSENGLLEINPGCQMSLPVPEVRQPTNLPLPREINSGAVESESVAEKLSPKENFSISNPESEKIRESVGELVVREVQKSGVIENFRNYHGEEKEDIELDKENVNPNLKKNTLNNLTPPLPPPRKLKRDTRPLIVAEEKQMEEKFLLGNEDINSEEDVGFNKLSVVSRYTPLKERQDERVISDIFEASGSKPSEISMSESILNEDVRSRKAILQESKSKSLIKKMISGNSPNLQKFSRSFRKSLTNLYDSVSSSERDLKSKESNDKNLKTTVVDGLHNRLKQLGVDPEWSGIPKKTMKQKLNALRYRRRLFSKENPMYPAIRQNIEEKIIQKLKKNLKSKKASLIQKLNKQGSMNTEIREVLNIEDDLLDDKPEFVKVKNCPMYDIDTDSESKASDSEKNFSQDTEQKPSQKAVIVEEFSSDIEERVDNKTDQEFDLSVFQVGGKNLVTEENSQRKEEELITDSDNDDDKSFKKLNSFLTYRSRNESKNPTGGSDNAEQSGKANSENQSILKEDGFQSKIPMNPKKKVLFSMSNVFDEELSDSPLDDDLWSFKSDWEKDTG